MIESFYSHLISKANSLKTATQPMFCLSIHLHTHRTCVCVSLSFFLVITKWTVKYVNSVECNIVNCQIIHQLVSFTNTSLYTNTLNFVANTQKKWHLQLAIVASHNISWTTIIHIRNKSLYQSPTAIFHHYSTTHSIVGSAIIAGRHGCRRGSDWAAGVATSFMTRTRGGRHCNSYIREFLHSSDSVNGQQSEW